jgi:hypothetical protein
MIGENRFDTSKFEDFPIAPEVDGERAIGPISPKKREKWEPQVSVGIARRNQNRTKIFKVRQACLLRQLSPVNSAPINAN